MSNIVYWDDLTKEEVSAIKKLDSAMKVLSKRHWFYSAGGDLNLIRSSDDNYNDESVNSEAVAAKISGYCVDGGDW